MIIPYLDDWLVKAASEELLMYQLIDTLTLLQQFDWVINLDKSSFLPATFMRFLGFIIDSQKMTLSVTPERCARILLIRVFGLMFCSRGSSMSPIALKTLTNGCASGTVTHEGWTGSAPCHTRPFVPLNGGTIEGTGKFMAQPVWTLLIMVAPQSGWSAHLNKTPVQGTCSGEFYVLEPKRALCHPYSSSLLCSPTQRECSPNQVGQHDISALSMRSGKDLSFVGSEPHLFVYSPHMWIS